MELIVTYICLTQQVTDSYQTSTEFKQRSQLLIKTDYKIHYEVIFDKCNVLENTMVIDSFHCAISMSTSNKRI